MNIAQGTAEMDTMPGPTEARVVRFTRSRSRGEERESAGLGSNPNGNGCWSLEKSVNKRKSSVGDCAVEMHGHDVWSHRA